jgi:type II secretory ATPase GspE/PulE/Tfp pilus assembly ATPase PilB-like protein
MEQKLSDKFVGAVLRDKGVIGDKEIAIALADQFGLEMVDLKQQHIDMELARKFSTSLILDHKCFPLSEDEYTLTVAIVNPLNAVAINKMEEEASPKNVNLVMVAESELSELIQNYRQYISQSIQRLLKRKPADSSGGQT